jgi:hypothetical protein
MPALSMQAVIILCLILFMVLFFSALLGVERWSARKHHAPK